MNVNYLCWNKVKDPGIPAHLSVTRILFEIDVNQGTRGRCLQLRIEEKQKEKKKGKRKEKVGMERRPAFCYNYKDASGNTDKTASKTRTEESEDENK